jgi:hypothetical protein
VTDFADLLEALNQGGSRRPGQWTPSACAVWRNAVPEDARLLEAVVAVELGTGRWVRAFDEDEVRQRLQQMVSWSLKTGQMAWLWI